MVDIIGKADDIDEALLKVVNPEGEIEVQINGKDTKIFWAKQGFGSRIYFKAYAMKKVEQYLKEGLLKTLKFSGSIKKIPDGKKTFFTLQHQGIIEETLKAFESEALTMDYAYNPEVSALYFDKPPKGELKVEYEYYDPKLYKEIVNDATLTMMVFLSARKVEDKTRKYFDNIDEVESLNFNEISGIFDKYNKSFAVNNQEIKNLQPPLVSEDATPLQRNSN